MRKLIYGILYTLLFGLIGLQVLIISFSIGCCGAAQPPSWRSWRYAEPGCAVGSRWPLALSIHSGEARDVLLTVTYQIFLISILIKGFTIRHVVKSC